MEDAIKIAIMIAGGCLLFSFAIHLFLEGSFVLAAVLIVLAFMVLWVLVIILKNEPRDRN